jgi:thiamine biosynthesis lipoprotein
MLGLVGRAILVAPLLLLCFTALSAQSPMRVEAADEAMGTSFSLTLYGQDRALLDKAAAAAFAEAHRLDRMLSNYRPESEWSGINRLAATRPVHVTPELFHLLQECARYSRESEGAFDFTVGPLMRVWGFYRDEGSLASPAKVAGALRLVGYRHVLLDAQAQTVRFDREGVELDPGGIGKGYAVDRIVDVLRSHGVGVALVSAGGSSLYGMGAPPESSEGWRVPIRAPGDPHQVAAEVTLNNMSLSTSGSYERFFRANGRVYSHIMDPRTGFPAQGTSGVSVLTARTIDSEAWTKPYFINGRAWTTAHKAKSFRVFLCDDSKSRDCAWIP